MTSYAEVEADHPHHHHHHHHSKKKHKKKKHHHHHHDEEEEEQEEEKAKARRRTWTTILVCLMIVIVIVVPISVVVSSTGGGGGLSELSNSPQSVVSSFSNADPRLDVNGVIMDIHDGNIIYKDGLYYYYGAQYGECSEYSATLSGCDVGGTVWGTRCGFRTNHNMSLFTSPDMMTWTPAPNGPPFQMQRDFQPSFGQPAILFSPKVLYNYNTQKWVLWFNYNLKNPDTEGSLLGVYGVATSPSPFGPFEVIIAPVMTLTRMGPSDSMLWQDDVTHVGYFIYSGEHEVGLEQMTPDFLGTLGAAASSGSVGPAGEGVEAPMFFRRNGLYHLVFGPECCYCAPGSAVVVYTSCSPLGPYTASTTLSAQIPSQSTDIARFWDANGTAQFLFRGDRWQQAPDGLKGHDPTYVGVIQFDSNGIAQPLPFLNTFTQSVSQVNQEGYQDINTACP